MDWCLSLPKVELHAHLNGSIRDSTLLELARDLGEKGLIDFSDVEHVIKKNDRSVSEVFRIFDLIHKVTTNHATLTRITKEVVEDFAAENVVYLELRTTPKRNDAIGMSKRSYMEAIVKGLRAVSNFHLSFVPNDGNDRSIMNSTSTDNEYQERSIKKMHVRLLLSIDRRETTAAAMETVMLALELKHLGVIGIDLSGNPEVGEWMTYFPALNFAREQGLFVTLHCGEVPNSAEIKEMLNFCPQRIGHACCFEKDDWEKLKSSNIPVEICLTSNIRTVSIASIEVHHFADLYNSKHPVVLCTDDPGVFSTSLSNEYNLAASTFGIGRKDMFELAKSAIEFIFADGVVKEDVRATFALAARKLNI